MGLPVVQIINYRHPLREASDFQVVCASTLCYDLWHRAMSAQERVLLQNHTNIPHELMDYAGM